MKGNSKSIGRVMSAVLLANASVIGLTVPMGSAQAQTLTPVVDVCTGISIDQSAVTTLLTAVNQPIVTPLQGAVNGLLGILIPPLNINVAGIVSNAVANNPLSVQVLNSNGTIVGPGDCNLTADAITLNTAGGLAIGGNQITGLGTGAVANAGTADAIAFGDGATTGIAAGGAVAIGTGAQVTAANSIAIGNGSIASRGALAGYAAPGLTGTFNSAGSFSVGSAGALRQITNVAPGTAATDAATVGQLQGALNAVAALDADGVQYTDSTHAAVALDGVGGTTISGVAAGTLAATSTDAVNGAQLFATNQAVAANTGTAATNTAAIAALDASAVQYDSGTLDTVTLGGAAGTRVTNVTAGRPCSCSPRRPSAVNRG